MNKYDLTYSEILQKLGPINIVMQNYVSLLNV